MARHSIKLEADIQDNQSAAYYRAVQLVGKGNLPAAVDGMLDILKADKNYLKGEAREVTVGILEMMDPNDQETRNYRNELSSVLF